MCFARQSARGNAMQIESSACFQQPENRSVTIDVFRGLTMLLMLFVNDLGDSDLGHIQGAPGWLKHMPGTVDGMTVADVIFPCFLFIVGLSIPRALGQRLAAGDSPAKICTHIVTRALALIFIGLCMVNSCHGVNVTASGMSGAAWRLLMFTGVILCWNRYPKAEGARKRVFVGLRVAGALLLIYLLSVYRVSEDGAAGWMRQRWWGIIGLIGWAYLASAFVWLLCRNRTTALLGVFGLLIALNIGLRYGVFGCWENLVRAAYGWVPSLRLGANASMAVAGLTVAALCGSGSATATHRVRIGGTLLFGMGCAVAGLLLRQPWGIHKNGGTPAWILVSLSIACAAYALLSWLIEVKRHTRWTAPFAQAGSNTLLMYMLPYIFYSALALMSVDFLKNHASSGWLGVARSAAVSLSLAGATVYLTRLGIRLKV